MLARNLFVAAVLALASIVASVPEPDSAAAEPTPVTKLTHEQAMRRLRAARINVTSSSGRVDASRDPGTTSFQGVRSRTIDGIIAFKKRSGCAITITGGTERGHDAGQFSHAEGYKLDIKRTDCVWKYITKNFQRIGNRSDGAPRWRSPTGDIYAREGLPEQPENPPHWDILYY